ncbi:MAG: hypothetical protein KC593_06630 [Myxococcales bacterium]|nr:hypothetical protein [Myxococcales bacterium]
MSLRLWTWELPQTLIGRALKAVRQERGKVLAVERMADGRELVETEGIAVSLGGYVFWSRTDRFGHPFEVDLIRAHELGHTVQSRRLGWLYLPVVGVVSSTRALYAQGWQHRHGRPWPRYYDAWPESAADAYGGIIRDERGQRRLPPTGSPLDQPL